MSEVPIFFSGWAAIGRTVLLGVTSYLSLVVLLRLSGKRTLSKMNMFDFVITVAFGSVLASMLLSKTVTLAQGVVAFATLIGLQFAVTWTSVRVERFEELIKAEPALLYHRGRWLRDRMRRERMSEEELKAASRQQGVGSMSEVGALILETDGSISVVKASSLGDGDALPRD